MVVASTIWWLAAVLISQITAAPPQGEPEDSMWKKNPGNGPPQDVFLDEQTAKAFQRSIVKRDLVEECREDCWYEEVHEIYENNHNTMDYMLSYHCRVSKRCRSGTCVGSRGYSKLSRMTSNCRVHGGWGSWSTWRSWGACSVTCGNGRKYRNRIRVCNNPIPRYGGSGCSGSDNHHQDTRCHDRICAVIHGGWSTWQSWFSWRPCSMTCGNGRTTRYRYRLCDNPTPNHWGNGCSGLGYGSQYGSCRDLLCPVIGGWGNYSSWSDCSVSCGNGTQNMTRQCDSPSPAHGGNTCGGSSMTTRVCYAGTECPVDGGWDLFSVWSTCSVSCGNGTQNKTRRCDSPSPAHGGNTCGGSSMTTRVCYAGIECMVDGGWSAFSARSTCSVSCGNGTQNMMRRCDNPSPAHGGRTCDGSSTAIRNCYSGIECPIDGAWGIFSPWSTCPVSCGNGTHSRIRRCDNPSPAHGGRACGGSQISTRDYFSGNECPVDGAWGVFTVWSTCSVSCGNGTQNKTRRCDNPSPAHGGGCVTDHP